MEDIATWLKSSVSGGTPHVAENDISFAILPELTDQDLKEIAVSSLGHRRQLLRAIARRHDAAKPAAHIVAAVARLTTGRSHRHVSMSRSAASSRSYSATWWARRRSRQDSIPTIWRSAIGVYHKCVAETVAGFDGFVPKYMGDGVSSIRVSRTHEDNAERAVRAGRALLEAARAAKIRQHLSTRHCLLEIQWLRKAPLVGA
jgi:class 3 adenylate cyclase